MESGELIFGPLPSRRLGQSLGINNTLLPKACSYNCIYCQVGRTHHPEFSRRAFFDPQHIFDAVSARLKEAEAQGIHIDYLSFVPDGEPTLDIRLGETIGLLRKLNKPIAVFSNASLIWRPDVRADLSAADWVSLKFDSVEELTWRKTDRPAKMLNLQAIMDGARAFARQYAGVLVTETMLCAGLNDEEDNLMETAGFIAELQPAVAYIGAPTRPPLESWALPPDEAALTKAFAIFAAYLPNVELMIGYPPLSFQPGSNAEQELPAIVAVHPMRESEVLDYLYKCGADAGILNSLVAKGVLKRVEHAGEGFWVRVIDQDFFRYFEKITGNG